MLRSVDAQEKSDSWSYELRLAVDGCEATSSKLLELGRAHWWSPKNVGPYIIRNSLVALEPADAFAIFDADDVMLPDYLTELLRFVGRDGIVGPARKTIDEEGRLISKRSPYSSGIAVFSGHAWRRLGGYRPWRIAADYDMILRAQKLGIRVRPTRTPFYLRRLHPGSLTQDPETRMHSPERLQAKERAERLTELGLDMKVQPVTTSLEWRHP